MSIKGLAIGLSSSILAFGAAGLQAHDNAPDNNRAGEQKHYDSRQHSGELVEAVRDSTRRFKDVNKAQGAGYQLLFGCVSGPDDGAMGMHYVNLELVADGVLDVNRPEIVIYEPTPNGGRRLIGADFLVFADAWHASNTATPEIMGQLMHLIDAPNRYGLPSFYTLHVWAWKSSPTGAFVNWHSDVSCENYGGQEQ